MTFLPLKGNILWHLNTVVFWIKAHAFEFEQIITLWMGFKPSH